MNHEVLVIFSKWFRGFSLPPLSGPTNKKYFFYVRLPLGKASIKLFSNIFFADMSANGERGPRLKTVFLFLNKKTMQNVLKRQNFADMSTKNRCFLLTPSLQDISKNVCLFVGPNKNP